jgi:hypothetical protein
VTTYIETPFLSEDGRNIVFQSTRRTNDGTVLRDPTSAEIATVGKQWAAHTDQGRNNGLLSPVSAIILICCGAGGGCHNNIQFVNQGGMGSESYVASNVGKGVGKLIASLPALYEAKNSNKVSVHPDVASNPVRATAYILQKSINNYSKKREYWGRRGLGGLDIYIYISEIPRDPGLLTFRRNCSVNQDFMESWMSCLCHLDDIWDPFDQIVRSICIVLLSKSLFFSQNVRHFP